MNEKIVGIIGGMGPEATVDLMMRIIRFTPARDDSDHIRMIVDNNPKVPSRIKAIIEGTGENPAPVLIDMAKKLQNYGADFLAIPCNTAHYYYNDIQAAVSIPILNMITLTLDAIRIKQPGIKTVGLLASTAVLITGLFKNIFVENDVNLVYPPEFLQEKVLQSIRQIKSGSQDEDSIKNLQVAADQLCSQNAEAIVIGCTELSVIANQIKFKVEVYDSAQVLAENVVKTAIPGI